MAISVRAMGSSFFPDGSKRCLTLEEVKNIVLKAWNGESVEPFTVNFDESSFHLEGYRLDGYLTFKKKGLQVAYIYLNGVDVGIAGYVEEP